jgi:hypothetical protein
MLRDVFKSIGGFESYGMISMLIFVVFFILLVLHAVTMKTGDVEDFSRMPFDEGLKESDEIHEI